MSLAATQWAWEKVREPAVAGADDALVLVYLAYIATPDGRCWPGVDRITNDLVIEKRRVRSCLRELEDRGLVRLHRNDGQATMITLLIERKGR